MAPPTPASPSHVAVITGGSSGIGLATALLFARRGWRVGLIARGEAALVNAADQIRAEGGRVATAVADVADRAALTAAAASIAAELGPVEVWVNDAGASFVATFQDTTDEEFHRVVDTTFFGQVNGTRVALEAMAPRGRGVIVGIGSEVAFRAMPMLSAYSASKFALRGFYEALRSELMAARSPIHVGMVHPPAINSPFFAHAGARLDDLDQTPAPPPPYYEPELIAEAVWLVATERRRELKVTGATVGMALANAIAPGLLDQVLARVGFGMQLTRRRDAAAARDPALMKPSRRAPAVRGVFGDKVMKGSAQMWLARNRYTIGLSTVALLWATRGRRRHASR